MCITCNLNKTQLAGSELEKATIMELLWVLAMMTYHKTKLAFIPEELFKQRFSKLESAVSSTDQFLKTRDVNKHMKSSYAKTDNYYYTTEIMFFSCAFQLILIQLQSVILTRLKHKKNS